VQEIALAATFEFAQHGFTNHTVAFVAHKGFDGQAALWRSGDDAQITQAFKRHAERARNRRGGEREHIHLGAHGFHGFFVAHAKAVFFVDDEQAQVFELDRLAEQLVRAHHDVDLAFSQTFGGSGDFFGRAKAAHLGNFDGPFAEAVHQGLVMLLGQQSGGGQEGHLLATRHGHKGSAQGHLGFAKAHIATHQAVHGAWADHVLHDGVDGGALVGGFFKAKVVGKGFVVLRRVAEGVALACGAAGVDVQQLGGGIAHLFGSAAFGFVPLCRAEFVQRRFVGTHAGVAANQVQLAHRHIEHGVVGVFEVQELLQRGCAVGVLLAQVHVDEATVAANAVGVVHHGVAQVELGQVFDERFDIAHLFLFFAASRGRADGKQFGLGDQVEASFGPAKANLQCGGGNADFFGAAFELCQRIKRRWADVGRAQEVEQAFAAAIALGQDEQAVGCFVSVHLQLLQRVCRTAHHGEVGQGLGKRVVDHVGDVRAQRKLGVAVGRGVKLLGA